MFYSSNVGRILVCSFVVISCGNSPQKQPVYSQPLIEKADTTVPIPIQAPVSQDSAYFSSLSSEEELVGLGKPLFGDLDSMISRRRIRALVPFNHAFYYIDGKERSGIAYEGLNLFEKSLNDQLNFYPPRVRIVFIPVSREQIIPLLREGYADLAFAGMTINEERKKLVDFSVPTIKGLNEIVVGGPHSPKLKTIADLSGQHVFVQEHSSYYSALEKLNDSLKSVGIAPVIIEHIDPFLEVEDILELVNAGLMPFTIVVSDAAVNWKKVMDSLTLYPNLALNRNVSYGWVFRKGSPKLVQTANNFIEKNAKGTSIGNQLYKKYLTRAISLHHAHSPETLANLKSTSATFHKCAKEHRLDWLLLAAQGYQESHLNQQLVSSAGAVGIMQVKPSTAAQPPINIDNVTILENNVNAGAKYLRFVMDRYFSDKNMTALNSQLFALAAYNAGPARVAQLRKKARERGLNANLWFDHVEIIAAQDIGRETVQYVSNIYKYYTSYRSLKRYSDRSGKKILP